MRRAAVLVLLLVACQRHSRGAPQRSAAGQAVPARQAVSDRLWQEWVAYRDPEGAFSVRFPDPPMPFQGRGLVWGHPGRGARLSEPDGSAYFYAKISDLREDHDSGVLETPDGQLRSVLAALPPGAPPPTLTPIVMGHFRGWEVRERLPGTSRGGGPSVGGVRFLYDARNQRRIRVLALVPPGRGAEVGIFLDSLRIYD